MAGGQSLTSGQGSVVQGGAVPLAGLALAGSTGFFDFPVEEAIAGEEATGAQASKPDYFHTHFIRLRSRKAGGGGTAENVLFGSATQVLPGTSVAGINAPGVTQVATLSQGAPLKSSTKAMQGILVQMGTGLMIGNGVVPPSNWSVGNIDLVQGQTGLEQGQFDVSQTGPSNYVLGGTYDAFGGTPLPTGMTISPTGIVDVGSATAPSTAGVIFGYTEPNALPVLTINSTNAGTFPYMSAVYPCEGTVPAGTILLSPDDTTLRSNVLSTWEDGSAKVVVLAGTKTVTAASQTTISLLPGLPSGTALTAAFIDSLLVSVTTNFNATVATFTDFSNPDRIWWQNSQLICAQYHLDIGVGVMQAIIVVHAYAGGRTFVEVMIENGKLDVTLANPNSPVIPFQTYTGATVLLTPTGGVATEIQITVGGVSSPTTNMLAPNTEGVQAQLRYGVDNNGIQVATGHERGRAWYCSGWTNGTGVSKTGGASDPLIDVTHNTAYMRAHPFFFKPLREPTENMQTKYAQTYDTYVPWAACRLRLPRMAKGGDSDQIGLYTSNQSDYILTGSKYAARSTIQTGLAVACGALHFRHTDGTVPTIAQVVAKSSASNAGNTWPSVIREPFFAYSDDANRAGEAAHSPALGLVPFMIRPSPLWIEQVWKEQVLYSTANGHGSTGVFNFAQSRERGWRARNTAVATILTPDIDSTRKSGYRSALITENGYLNALTGQSWNAYGVVTADIYNPTRVSPGPAPFYTESPPASTDGDHSDRPGWQVSFFMHSFVAQAMHFVNSAKVLTGADQVLHTTLTDRLAGVFPKWINGTPDGDYSWRALPYQPTIGYADTHSTLDNHGLSMALLNQEQLSGDKTSHTLPGAFQFWDTGNPGDTTWTGLGELETNSYKNSDTTFGGMFLMGLMVAIEREVPGALTAWTKVYGTGANDGGINNFSTWANGFALDPKMNHKARNLP